MNVEPDPNIGKLIEVSKYIEILYKEGREHQISQYSGIAIIIDQNIGNTNDDMGNPIYRIYFQESCEYHIFSSKWFTEVSNEDLK